MGILNYPPLITEIYSNAMTSAYKNTEKHHLISMDLNFNDEAIEFVVLLELLKDFCNIKACDVLKLDKDSLILNNGGMIMRYHRVRE